MSRSNRNTVSINKFRRTRLFLYVVAASRDPDSIKCLVPWEVSSNEIFFGPCKKRLREEFHRQYLATGDLHEPKEEDIYLVGVNGANPKHERKIVWAGRVIKIMTFARANIELVGEGYRKLRERKDSPLHVAPLLDGGGELRGYKHISQFHDGEWALDLVTSMRSKAVEFADDCLRLRLSWEGFPRDACALCENIFFARGRGLAIDAEMLEILRQAQPGVEIDAYAVFGRLGGRVNGLRGRWLTIEGALADDLVACIKATQLQQSVSPSLRLVPSALCNFSS